MSKLVSPPKNTWVPYKWELMIWFWLAYFLGQGDRQVFNVVLPLVRDDLGLTDAHMGFVASSLMVVLALMVPLAGWVGDQYNRSRVIVFSLACWSIAGLLMGQSVLLWHVLILRCVAAGGGEAFYGPASNALIAEHHVSTRSLAMAIHQSALYTGMVVSGWVAGYVGERYGWRMAFAVFGLLGLLLAAVIFFRVKPSGKLTPRQVPLRQLHVSLVAAFRVVIARRTALLLTLAFAAMVFATIGYVTWMPTYLHEEFGLSLSAAGFAAMFWHHLAALVGVLLGGYLSDRWAYQRRSARLGLQMWGLWLGAPFMAVMGMSQDLMWVYLGLAAFGLFRGLYDANIFASVFDVIPPDYRSTSVSVMVLVAFFIGAGAPYLMGVLKPWLGLGDCLTLMGGVYVLGGSLIWWAKTFTFEQEYIGS